MNGLQFEELCRFFVARKLGLRVEHVPWKHLRGAGGPMSPGDLFQVDLCWETQTPLGRYLNIAEAKWRTEAKIERDVVMLLEQLRISVGAQKAMLISNAELTSGALSIARRLHIAVHRLTPEFSTDGMPAKDRAAVQRWLGERAKQQKTICTHEVKCKTMDMSDIRTGPIIPGVKVDPWAGRAKS